MSSAENAKQPSQSNISLTWGTFHDCGLSATYTRGNISQHVLKALATGVIQFRILKEKTTQVLITLLLVDIFVPRRYTIWFVLWRVIIITPKYFVTICSHLYNPEFSTKWAIGSSTAMVNLPLTRLSLLLPLMKHCTGQVSTLLNKPCEAHSSCTNFLNQNTVSITLVRLQVLTAKYENGFLLGCCTT